MEQVVQHHPLEQRLSTYQGKLLLPSLYLPPAELLSLAGSNELHVDMEIKWDKKCLFNRTRILGPNGIQTLTVPVHSTEGKPTALKEIRICYQHDWIRVHTGALSAAYNNSPFFAMFKDELFAVYSDKPVTLFELNERLNSVIIRRLAKRLLVPNPIDLSNHEPVTDCSHLKDIHSIQSFLPPVMPYIQVFSDRFAFTPFLSWVDWLSNTGGRVPQA